MLPAAEFHTLWGGDSTPQFPDDGSMPEWRTYFPPVGGFRFGMFSVPPATTAAPSEIDIEAGLADTETKLPGLLRYLDQTDPGMHTTDTVDYGICLEGELVLQLDDGAEVTLTPGTCVVQLGTRHRWVNRSERPALMCYVQIGARRNG